MKIRVTYDPKERVLAGLILSRLQKIIPSAGIKRRDGYIGGSVIVVETRCADGK